MRNTLIIRHLPGEVPNRFEVMRGGAAEISGPIRLPSPDDLMSQGKSFLRELRWRFNEYPQQAVESDRAEEFDRNMAAWGRAALAALFGDRVRGGWFAEAMRGDLHRLRLQIFADCAETLSWPWEWLGEHEPLGKHALIERRPGSTLFPPPLSRKLPKDRLNILLVTVRPFPKDAPYRSISRLLLRKIEQENWPIHLHVLRPPTLERLLQHLRDRPHFYHALHLDTHGGYHRYLAGRRTAKETSLPPRAQGLVLFEDENGGYQEVTASQIGPLLREFAIPLVVLNACRSAAADGEADSPFSSISGAFLQAAHAVVGMCQNLPFKSADSFFPGFYSTLFETGDVGEALRIGRQALLAAPTLDLEHHWMLPTLHRSRATELPFRPEGASRTHCRPPRLAAEDFPFGFVGRDREVLLIERALRGPAAGILLHGLPGVGKTACALDFADFLLATEGVERVVHVPFATAGSVERLIEAVSEQVPEAAVPLGSSLERIATLTAALRDQPFLVIWDGLAVGATFPKGGLLALLRALRGGRCKLLLTSRSSEDWLGVEALRIRMDGLQEEERWELCERILKGIGVSWDRQDASLVELMRFLGGRPSQMLQFLRERETRSFEEILASFVEHLSTFEPAA